MALTQRFTAGACLEATGARAWSNHVLAASSRVLASLNARDPSADDLVSERGSVKQASDSYSSIMFTIHSIRLGVYLVLNGKHPIYYILFKSIDRVSSYLP